MPTCHLIKFVRRITRFCFHSISTGQMFQVWSNWSFDWRNNSSEFYYGPLSAPTVDSLSGSIQPLSSFWYHILLEMLSRTSYQKSMHLMDILNMGPFTISQSINSKPGSFLSSQYLLKPPLCRWHPQFLKPMSQRITQWLLWPQSQGVE